jgi:cytoskeletal protein CcmA (bactofilin family)
MKMNQTGTFGLIAGGLVAGISLTAVQGCDDGGLGNLAEQCGLTCPAEGVAEGNFSISGIASVDAFFGAVVTFGQVTTDVSASINAELQAIAVSLDLEPGAAAADIKAELQAKISGAVQGGLKVNYAPPKCEVSAEATVEATARCDATVDPGMVEVECEGSCEASASAEASCDANAEVKCVAQAPSVACSGQCEGTCSAEGGVACEGTCNGQCDGTCSVRNAQGDCAGRCEGMCQGTCELKAAASCGGNCEGTCTFTPPDAKCEANASLRCEAKADAKVKCDGRCDGKVTPPKASAECEASAKAEVNAKVECKPPSLEITWQWSAALEGDVNAQAEFKAWLTGFKVRYAALLAAIKRVEFVLQAGADLSAAAGGAVKGAIEVQAEGDLDLKGTIGLGCALTELGAVAGVIETGTSRLTASANAAVEITTAIAP